MAADRLNIPEALSRPRDHAVICTFGAQLDFYEGPLWRHISRARNRVVLADDIVLARQLADLASGGSRLRHINRHYLAVPITNERSAHAKLILLVDQAGGSLLVGSGNVSIDGYASRGEAFCRYDITDQDLTYLPEFQAAKELLDLMASRGYLDNQARHHLDAMWSDAPWIWAPPPRAPGVRHNMTEPLADQLVAAVGGEQVLELTVHAPFHDERCEALRRLLVTLAPQHVTVLVQLGRTSVDPSALARVLDGAPATTEVQLAAAPEFTETYLHAKFIVVRTPTRSITFTGSANLSLAALYRTDRQVADRPAGNIELVNLLEGPPERFHDLLTGLDLTEPTEPIADLDVSYLGDHEHDDDDQARPRLTRGTWADGTLTLVAANELPPGDLTLVIAGTVAPGDITTAGTTITTSPAPEAAAVLDARVVPVWLRIAGPDNDVETTPVYPYHPSSLASLLAARHDPDLLRKAGDLDMEAYDDDLAALLDELDAALVIDRDSLWRLARRSPPPDNAGGDGDGPRRAWEDLDFNALRRHPRLAQYKDLGRPTERLEATDLQVVLSAITDHFREFGGDAPPVGATVPEAEGVFAVDLDEVVAVLPADRDDTPVDKTPEQFEADEDDDAEQDEERERRRLKTETRNRLAWQRFCERFTKALRDQDFLDVVGSRVAVANALILNHLLTLLVRKGVVVAEKGVACQVELWSFMWGEGDRGGYLDSLPDEEQMMAMEEFAERFLEITVLSAVDYAAQLTKHKELHDLRNRLRHVWRRMLTSPQLCFTREVLQRASLSGVRSAGTLTETLDHLAKEWTRRELDEAVAGCLGTSRSKLLMRTELVRRGQDRSIVEVIEIADATVVLTTDAALEVFSRVSTVDRDREYIRLKHLESGVVAAWDRRRHDCWWYHPPTDEQVDLDEPAPLAQGWIVASDALVAAGRAADQAAA